MMASSSARGAPCLTVGRLCVQRTKSKIVATPFQCKLRNAHVVYKA